MRERRIQRKIHDNFSNMIAYMRKKRGYSLKELEEMTGISASYINRLETGLKLSPSYPIIASLAQALSIPEHELLPSSNYYISEKKSTVKEKFIGEILLTSDFLLNEDVATKKEKKLFVDIVDEIIYCEWSEKSKIEDILQIFKLVDIFKSV